MRRLPPLLLLVLCCQARAVEVELTNGLVIAGELDAEFERIRRHAQGKSGTWAVTVRSHNGTPFHLFLQQIRRVRAGTDAPWTPVTPLATPAETFAGAPAARFGSVPRPCGWRGDGNGDYADAAPPTAFVPVWRVRVRSGAHSSPIVAGDRVFILDQPHLLVCFDKRTGARLWQRANPSHLVPGSKGMPSNDFVWETYRLHTPTPVTDGRFVYAALGNGPVCCYTVEGDRRWTAWANWGVHMRSGKPNSPTLCGDLLVTAGYGEDATLGLDRHTGAERWRHQWGGGAGKAALRTVIIDDRPHALGAGGILVDEAGTMHGRKLVKGNYGPTPVVVGDVAYLHDNKGKALVALRLARDGATETLWRIRWGGMSRSPLVRDGLLYVPGGTPGTRRGFSVLDAATGAVLDGIRIPGGYSSPVFAGDRIVLVTRRAIHVIVPGRELRVEREIPHPFVFTKHGAGTSGCTPIFDGNRWYFRDSEHLWCLAGGE